MIEFSKYAKIKDHYCICYFGYSDEYLVQLRLLKPVIERHLPGLKLFLGCKDEKWPILGEFEAILRVSELKSRRVEFAHIWELKFDGEVHPVEKLLSEAGITHCSVRHDLNPEHTQKAVIVTQGSYPTKPLEMRQIELLKRKLQEEGFFVEVDTDYKDAGVVAGVESVPLFEAAASGVRTILVPTGVGTRLYKLMFPNGEVLPA